MITLPRDDFLKQKVLSEIAQKFEKNKIYEESEVNEIIKSFDVDDYVLFRRELVNFGYLGKDSYKGTYWLIKSILTTEDKKKLKKLLGRMKKYVDQEED
jgi:hypothetical protein